jgi:hypothetical protein
MASEQLQGGSNTILHPGGIKPMVKASEYTKAREVLDALPDGVYLKCSKCRKWWRNSDIKFTHENEQPQYLCERCA